MGLPVATLKKGEGRMLKAGGLWIFDNEIAAVTEDAVNGELIAVQDFDGYPMGTGFYNSNSKITIRMMSRNKDAVIDEVFLRARVEAAWNYRKRTVDISSCRVIFGEADFLPGLVVDKFSDVLVVQSLAMGIDRMKETILRLLIEAMLEDGIHIRGVYERSDAKVRRQEGMQPWKGFLSEPFDTKVQIVENGVKYIVDVEEGQKTGFFLDQKYNRLSIHKICQGMDVLDCFTHTGSFALNAGIAGAKSVLGIDASQLAVDQATENAKLNGLQEVVKFQCEDVFALLPRLEAEGRKFDVIILDPPAFAKHKDALRNALQGYRKLNAKAFEKIKPGGILFTFSCSQVVSKDNFRTAVFTAAAMSGRSVRILHQLTQPADHPVNIYHPEGEYLKGLVLYVE